MQNNNKENAFDSDKKEIGSGNHPYEDSQIQVWDCVMKQDCTRKSRSILFAEDVFVSWLSIWQRSLKTRQNKHRSEMHWSITRHPTPHILYLVFEAKYSIYASQLFYALNTFLFPPHNFHALSGVLFAYLLKMVRDITNQLGRFSYSTKYSHFNSVYPHIFSQWREEIVLVHNLHLTN